MKLLVIILSEAITTTGAISADWVLVIVSSIAGTFGLIILNNMLQAIKNIIARQNEQEIKITQQEVRTEYAHERLDRLESIKT
jgi:hypothetical protein